MPVKNGFMRIDDVLKLIPVSKSTWWNGVKSGRFPKSFKLGIRITAWREEDIRDFINKNTIVNETLNRKIEK